MLLALVSYLPLQVTCWARGVVEEVFIEVLDLSLEIVVVFLLRGQVLVVFVVGRVEAHVQLVGEELVDLVHEELLAEGKSLIVVSCYQLWFFL